MDDIEKLRKAFVDENDDPADRADNEDRLGEWTKALTDAEALLSWQNHEYTAEIFKRFRAEYKFIGLKIATDRELTEDRRKDLFNKQDALSLMLSLMGGFDDPRKVIEGINREIRAAIQIADAT